MFLQNLPTESLLMNTPIAQLQFQSFGDLETLAVNEAQTGPISSADGLLEDCVIRQRREKSLLGLQTLHNKLQSQGLKNVFDKTCNTTSIVSRSSSSTRQPFKECQGSPVSTPKIRYSYVADLDSLLHSNLRDQPQLFQPQSELYDYVDEENQDYLLKPDKRLQIGLEALSNLLGMMQRGMQRHSFQTMKKTKQMSSLVICPAQSDGETNQSIQEEREDDLRERIRYFPLAAQTKPSLRHENKPVQSTQSNTQKIIHVLPAKGKINARSPTNQPINRENHHFPYFKMEPSKAPRRVIQSSCEPKQIVSRNQLGSLASRFPVSTYVVLDSRPHTNFPSKNPSAFLNRMNYNQGYY